MSTEIYPQKFIRVTSKTYLLNYEMRNQERRSVDGLILTKKEGQEGLILKILKKYKLDYSYAGRST